MSVVSNLFRSKGAGCTESCEKLNQLCIYLNILNKSKFKNIIFDKQTIKHRTTYIKSWNILKKSSNQISYWYKLFSQLTVMKKKSFTFCYLQKSSCCSSVVFSPVTPLVPVSFHFIMSPLKIAHAVKRNPSRWVGHSHYGNLIW